MTDAVPSPPLLGMYLTGGDFPTPGPSAWPSGPTTSLSCYFQAWGQTWSAYGGAFVTLCHDNSLVPYVELEPWHSGAGWNVTPLFSDITGGSWDAWLTGIGTAIAATGKTCILTFAHDFNVSGVYPWSTGMSGSGPGGGGLSASQWVAGWRYVHDKVNSTAGGHALWLWAPYAWTYAEGVSPAAYWPGSSYVDMVGVDGYPSTAYGASLGTFTGTFGQTFTAIRNLGWSGPVFVSETNLAQMVASGGQSITSFVQDMHAAGGSGILEFEDAGWGLPQMTAGQWSSYNAAVAAYFAPGVTAGLAAATAVAHQPAVPDAQAAPPPSGGGVTAPPGWPRLIVEGGFVTVSPVQPGGTLVLDDLTDGKLNVGTLGADTTWSEITRWVRSGSISHAASRQQGPLYDYQVTTLSLVLNNKDGRFDPDNMAGPYTAAGDSQLEPMVPIRVRALWNGISYPLFTGYADGWADDGRNYAGRYAELTLTASDGQKVLNGIILPDVAGEGAGETSGARINRILDLAQWHTGSGYRKISTGESTVQAYTGGSSAWSLMKTAADSEMGELWIDTSGRVVFRARTEILTDADSSTVQLTLGDSPESIVPEGGTSPPLNVNPAFEAGTDSWAAEQGAVLGYSHLPYGRSAGALSMHGNGTTANPRAVNDAAAVSPDTDYSAIFVIYTPSPWPVMGQVDWYTGGSAYISSGSTSSVSAGTSWQVLTWTGTAPGTAATGKLIATMNGTPGSSVHAYVAYAALIEGDLSSLKFEEPYTGATHLIDDSTLANDIQATRIGGAMQEAKDAVSIAKFLFPRSYARSDLILQSDPVVMNWAQWMLYISKDPENRLDTITVSPRRDPDNMWPAVLGRKMADLIQLYRRPPGAAPVPITENVFIRGIQHDWNWSQGTWTTTWMVEDASKYIGAGESGTSFLILDNALTGRLNYNILAF